MNSLTDLAGKPHRLTVRVKEEVREYLVYPLTVDEFAEFQGWIDAQFPDPFAVASQALAKGDFTVPQQQHILNRAMDLASQPKHPIGTPEADRLLLSFEGSLQMLWKAIRKGRPEFTAEEAKEVRLWMTMVDLQALNTYTGAALLMSDPKKSKTTSAGTGSSTSRRRSGKGSTSGSSTTKRCTT
jgi:hypothetical protein